MLTDPYAEKKRPWGRYAIITLVVLALLGGGLCWHRLHSGIWLWDVLLAPFRTQPTEPKKPSGSETPPVPPTAGTAPGAPPPAPPTPSAP